MASGKKRSSKQVDFRNTQLGDALQTQDMAAVAFALRHGPTVVPLMRPGARDDPRDSGEVWTFRDPNTGDVALLLHDQVIFGVVDEWLSGLDDEVFDDLLPLVRRTFSRFEPGERRQVGTLVSTGGLAPRSVDDADVDLERGAPAMAKMAELLGLELQSLELDASEVVS